ncbi:hypothetical protein ACFL4X_02590 [Gemmatimonadota bacterium]
MKTTVVISCLLAVLLLAGIATTRGNGGEGQTALAGTLGLAARYPGDAGIENDSAVVFAENFESISVSDLSRRWTEVSNSNNSVLYIVKDTTAPSAGKYCLRMTGTKGQNSGGHLWKLLDEGYEQLYARFYVKFAPDAPYVHHFVALGGKYNSPPYPAPGAGSRPDGTSSFLTFIDLIGRDVTNPPGAWSFYSYWCEMHSWQSPEGVPDGQRPAPYYGNLFGPEEPLQARRDEWQCVEIMIKLNDPEQRDGEQTFWIDGKFIERYGPGTIEGTWFTDRFRRSGEFNTDPKPFEGYRWRTDDRVQINNFWLEYYLASVFANDYNPHDPDIPYNDNIARVYFDNIVLATEYIGPIADGQQPGGDYNGDGEAGILDVIRLIRLCMEEYPDGSADYNRDGVCNVTDALALLIDIMKG